MVRANRQNPFWEGMFFVFLGTLIFSFTLPMTRTAAPLFGGWTVGFGRVVIAGAIAAVILLVKREKFPERRHWPAFAVVIAGVIFGFPILTSLALQSVPANHAAISTGIIPIGTGILGIIRARQKPPLMYWVSCALAIACVVLFALAEGAGALQPEDLLLFGAVTLASFGYVEGGRLAAHYGGWRVISWAVAVSMPAAIVLVLLSLNGRTLPAITPEGWISFLYLCVFSQLLGFFAMYRGLAVGGVARVSSIQLVQPFLTIVWAGLLISEEIKPLTMVVAVLVIGNVAFSQWVWRRDAARQRTALPPPLEQGAAGR
jgi:drug/metabolite transporter (DMT)-like permease